MATSKDYIIYLTEQWSGLDVSFRPMMGEYLLYYRGKLVGDVCDGRVFIKPVGAAVTYMPNAERCSPYNGAKEMLVLEDPENVEFVFELFEAMYFELPEPKPRKKKVQK